MVERRRSRSCRRRVLLQAMCDLGGQLVDGIFPPPPPPRVLALKHFHPVKGNRTGKSSRAEKSGPVCCVCRLGALWLISALFLSTLWIWTVLKTYRVCRQQATPPDLRAALEPDLIHQPRVKHVTRHFDSSYSPYCGLRYRKLNKMQSC